jgi:ketosteroid isomerase-like protein
VPSTNEAIARNSLAGWALLDMDRMVEGWAAGVVWDMSPYRPAWPGPAEYVGVPAILVFLAEWLARWETQSLWPEEFVEGQDCLVVILGRHGVVRATGTEVDRRWAQLWTFRDGEVTRIANYSDPDEARAALAAGV